MAPSSDLLDSALDNESIADTAERVRQLLTCCQEIHDERPRKFASAQLARFNLWASNIGVFATRHASLDYRLRTAPMVKVAIQGNLEILCRHLLSVLKASADLSEEELDEFSGLLLPQTHNFGLKLVQASSSDDQLRVVELGFVEETIGTLHHLSLAIRKASNRNSLTSAPRLLDSDGEYTLIREVGKDPNDLVDLVKAVRYEISSTFEEFVRKVLVSRWLRPDHEAELDSEQKRYREALLERCVKVVSARRRQLVYFRNHQLKLSSVGLTKFASSTRQPNDQDLGKEPSFQVQNKHLKGLNPAQQTIFEFSDAAPSETIGSELQTTAIRLAPASTAPSSTASSNFDGGFRVGGPFEVPPPPRLDPEEKEKTCPYCCLVLPAKTFFTQKRARNWEKHLLEDLQPYLCLFEHCNQKGKSYSSFKDWQTHLGQPHTHSWLCPLHLEDEDDLDGGSFLFDKLASFQDHLETYHNDLDLSNIDDLAGRASQKATLPQWCFVCFEALPALPMLQKHMANHFKSMSLLALPWREDIKDDEILASDQLKSSRAPSHANPPSENDLATTSLFEDADASVTSGPTLEPKEFASLLSAVNATPLAREDRMNDFEVWKQGPGKSVTVTTDSDIEDSDHTLCSEPRKNTIRSQYKGILYFLNNNTFDLTNPAQLKEYKYRILVGRDLGQETRNGINFLHLVVQDAKDPVFDRYQPFVRLLVERHPQLMKVRNLINFKRTPLQDAILKRREKLVRFLCQKYSNIGSVLRIPDQDHENCIHAAIRGNVSPELAIILFKLAGQDTVCAVNDLGFTPLHFAVEYERCTAPQLVIVEALIECGDKAMDIRTKENISPYQHHKLTSKRARKYIPDSIQRSSEPVTEESAKAIGDSLKLHCMRTRSYNDTVSFLYGRNQEKEIRFDLSDLSYLISKNFLSAYDHLIFEDMLQYVYLPSFNLSNDGIFSVRPYTLGAKVPVMDRGRSDFVYIFDWLRRKGVTRIVRVVVDDKVDDDTTTPSHSDEAIEQALIDFNVDIWDWRKFNVNIETIVKASPGVREVNLYWSRNPSVIEGWAQSGGISLLKKLKKIHLHVKEGPRLGTLSTIRRFEEYIERLGSDIEVKVEGAIDGS